MPKSVKEFRFTLFCNAFVMIPNDRTDEPWQTVFVHDRMLRKERVDQRLHNMIEKQMIILLEKKRT